VIDALVKHRLASEARGLPAGDGPVKLLCAMLRAPAPVTVRAQVGNGDCGAPRSGEDGAVSCAR
jgi:hypothetical protein